MSRGYMPRAETTEWSTPAKLFDAIDAEFGPITCDPCCLGTEHSALTVLSRGGRIYVPPRSLFDEDAEALQLLPDQVRENGLTLDWPADSIVYMNPPYGSSDPLFEIVPRAFLQQAHLFIERLATVSDGCGHTTNPVDGSPGDLAELDRHLSLVSLGNEERQNRSDDQQSFWSGDPPSIRATLVRFTGALMENSSNAEQVAKSLNGRFVNHLDGQEKLVHGRSLIRATRRGLEFAINPETTLAVNDASGPRNICVTHEVIIPSIVGFIRDVTTASAGMPNWIEKAVVEATHRVKRVIALLPVRSDTKAWQDYIMREISETVVDGHEWFTFERHPLCRRVRFLSSGSPGMAGTRVKFGNQKDSAPFPSVLVVWERSS